MKSIAKSDPEPTDLSLFRQKYPRGTWDQLRAEGRAAYDSVRQQLRIDQGGLCAYCEIKLVQDNEQVAHFHPKGDIKDPAMNWALEWSNLWLACKGGTQKWPSEFYLEPLPENRSCDENKENEIVDDRVPAPAAIPPFPRLVGFRQEPDKILIVPDLENCENASINPEKVQDALTLFNLNCERLARARLSVHREIERAIKKLRDSNRANRESLRLLVEYHLGKSGDNWPQFFTMIRWRFGVLSEEYLTEIQYVG